VALEDIRDPYTDEIIVESGKEIDEEFVQKIEDSGPREKCSSARCSPARALVGVCGKCYGRDLARGHLVNIGRGCGRHRGPVDRRAGVPQLTMRTFHHRWNGVQAYRAVCAGVPPRTES